MDGKAHSIRYVYVHSPYLNVNSVWIFNKCHYVYSFVCSQAKILGDGSPKIPMVSRVKEKDANYFDSVSSNFVCLCSSLLVCIYLSSGEDVTRESKENDYFRVEFHFWFLNGSSV